MPAKEIILKLLLNNVGRVVSNDIITKATGIRSWARQLRFLRQEGYDIKFVRKENGYILLSEIKKEGQKRVPINQKQRYRILKRNGFRCRACGLGASDGVKLQVDHKVPVDWKGKELYENGDLQTYCEPCNLGKKNFYSDFDREEIEKIFSLKSGTAKIEFLFRQRKGQPISYEVLEAISEIRDWERTLRHIRQKNKMNIIWNRKSKTYTFIGNK